MVVPGDHATSADGAGGEHAITAAALRHCAERDHGSGDLAVASWAADQRPSLGAMTPSKTRILLPDENVDKTLRRVTSIWRARLRRSTRHGRRRKEMADHAVTADRAGLEGRTGIRLGLIAPLVHME